MVGCGRWVRLASSRRYPLDATAGAARVNLPTDPRAATDQAIAEAFKRMAPDDYKPMPDRPVPMDSEQESE